MKSNMKNINLIIWLSFILLIGFSNQTISCNPITLKKEKTPIHCQINFNGQEREYFIWKPHKFNKSKKYWLMVIVHGGGGNGRTYFLTRGIREVLKDTKLDVIIVTPSFSNTDGLASRFPVLGEGDFLKKIINEVHGNFKLHPKILLTGYSRGGQFTHRFAFNNPELVKACATFAAGTWTTPDGNFLIEPVGKVSDPLSYLSIENNKYNVPERLHNLFTPRVGKVAGLKAKEEVKQVPFLVMCGSLDTRFKITQEFALSLKEHGFNVETSWPKTPHGDKEKYKSEFIKYSQKAVEFFKSHTDE